MTLLEKQQAFSEFVSKFTEDLLLRGYKITLGEAYRPPEMAQVYASQGKGIANSNHTIRLAIDLNIFLDGRFLTSKEDLTIPGQIWKSYSSDLIECCWGGDFAKTDADHFSFSHGNIK